MNTTGATVWYFPDGYLPQKVGGGPMEAHEALMLLNANSTPASVKLDIYFDDQTPVKGIAVEVGPERVRTVRLDHPEEIGGLHIPPLKQYAIRVRSDIPIVAQFARVDTTQKNLAYYGTMGFWADSD